MASSSYKDIPTPYVIIRVTRFATYYFKSNDKGNEQTTEQEAREIIRKYRMNLQKVQRNELNQILFFIKNLSFSFPQNFRRFSVKFHVREKLIKIFPNNFKIISNAHGRL